MKIRLSFNCTNSWLAVRFMKLARYFCVSGFADDDLSMAIKSERFWEGSVKHYHFPFETSKDVLNRAISFCTTDGDLLEEDELKAIRKLKKHLRKVPAAKLEKLIAENCK